MTIYYNSHMTICTNRQFLKFHHDLFIKGKENNILRPVGHSLKQYIKYACQALRIEFPERYSRWAALASVFAPKIVLSSSV